MLIVEKDELFFNIKGFIKMKFWLALFLAFSLTLAGQAFAQEEEEIENEDEKTEETEEEGDFDDIFEDDEYWDGSGDDWDFDIFGGGKTSIESDIPVLKTNFGMYSPYFEGAERVDIKSVGAISIKIGTGDIYESEYSPNVIEYSETSVFLDYFSMGIGADDVNPDENEATAESWRFGFTDNSGYGYKLGENSHFLFYTDDGICWTKFNFENGGLDSLSQYRFDRYGDSFRFGDEFEAGIQLRPFKYVAINAGYHRAVVFERHMFWYWAASEIIEEAARGVVGIFSDKVFESSPVAGPVVDWVLKNAVSYGIYELKKSDMNWPIETAAPIMYDGYKVGLTFMF